MLREGESNYLGAVMLRGKAGGCAFADVSTGEVCAASFETDAAMHIQNEISRFRPRECVLAPEAMLSRDIRDTLEKRYQNYLDRVRQLNSEDVFQTFMNAYASSIEPHTNYLGPRASENFDIAMKLSLEGIGAVLQRTKTSCPAVPALRKRAAVIAPSAPVTPA